LYVGRLDERKGIKFLVESMRIINSVDAEIRLHIVGDGEYKDKLQQVSSTNKSNIIFHGFISDSKVAKIYEDIKLQIIPSMFEGFGLTVVEAMAKNIPVIATDVDGITDIVHDNENGILVKFGDHQALANAVIGLMNNDKKRSELKNIAFKSIDKFNWKTVYQQTALVYKSLC
jgi:glycosyltransferase involved in cell wall biosynthesis